MPTNLLTDARGALAVELKTGGLRAFSAYPGEDDVTYPLVYVTGSQPYVTYEGASFGSLLVHCDAIVIASEGDSPSEATELDTQVLAVLDALRVSEWQVDQVDQPVRVVVADKAHLAVRITCQHEFYREPPEESP